MRVDRLELIREVSDVRRLLISLLESFLSIVSILNWMSADLGAPNSVFSASVPGVDSTPGSIPV